MKRTRILVIGLSLLFVFQLNAYSQNNKLDKVPDSFEFTDEFDVGLNQEIISTPVIVKGIDVPVSLSILGGNYSINNGNFTRQKGTLQNNDEIRVLIQSADVYGKVATLILYVEDIPHIFNVRTVEHPDSGWARLPIILTSITKPTFPDVEFNILDYGAVSDGVTKCTSAFDEAIKACRNAGGGSVVVPAGNFLTGPIHLLSNTNLHLLKGAYIKFSTTFSDYLPVVYTRFEGTELYNYSPCVYAFEQQNIAITGQGTLDAQGANSNWWAWKTTGSADVNSLLAMAEKGLPVEDRIFGAGHYIRPNMIQPYRCTNVLIDSVTVLNGPMWHIHPVLSTNVTVSNVTVVGHGRNNDGCNPESCTNVLIKNCYFNTGDDCIAIKSGRNADGRRVNVPTSYIVIQGCEMKDGHGGVVIGSEISGGAHHIYAEDCQMDSPQLDRALRIKTNSIRGGIIENIYMRNIEVGQVADAAIRVNFNYGEGDISTYVPIVRNIEVTNMTCNKANYAIEFAAYKRSPVQNVRLINCTFNNIKTPFTANYYSNLCLDNTIINGSDYNIIMNPDGVIDSSLASSGIEYLATSDLTFDVFPNPIDQDVQVQFVIPEKAFATIDLMDISGRIIENKFSGVLNAGQQSINLKFSEMRHGAYIIAIWIDDESMIKRVLFL